MARTNEMLIEEIIEIDSDIQLKPFIDTASALVDWLVTQDEDNVLTDDLLKQIETYLAAHFYSHRDQLFTSKSTGGASGSFQVGSGNVLLSTEYGRTACLLDVTGILAKRSKEVEEGGNRKVRTAWLGTENYGLPYA